MGNGERSDLRDGKGRPRPRTRGEEHTLERAMGKGAEAQWRAQRALDELALEMGEPRGWRALVN